MATEDHSGESLAPRPSLPEGAFDGPRAFAERIRLALAQAATEGWPELVFSDPDFADWPLGERAVVQSLQAWAGAGRSLRLVAGSFDAFQRQHARFVPWRQRWDHIVQCRECNGPGAAEVPSALWTPAWFLHRIDPLYSRGLSSSETPARVALRHAIDECFRKGRPGFPASVAGL